MKFYTTTLFTVLILSVLCPVLWCWILYASSAVGGPGECTCWTRPTARWFKISDH